MRAAVERGLLLLFCFSKPSKMPSATETVTSAIHSLSIRPQAEEKPDAPAVSTTPSPASAPKQKLQWPSQNAKPGESYKYERFLPYFDHDLHLPPLQPFEHVDPGTLERLPSLYHPTYEITSPSPSGLKALDDPEPRSFLNGASVEELTPEFGSEVEGVQLHELDARGRQQLARYVAERGVVVSLAYSVSSFRFGEARSALSLPPPCE